jgi:hypothetical protein
MTTFEQKTPIKSSRETEWVAEDDLGDPQTSQINTKGSSQSAMRSGRE